MLLFWFIFFFFASSQTSAEHRQDVNVTTCDPPCPVNTTVCALYLGAPTCVIQNATIEQKCDPECLTRDKCVELPNGKTICLYGRMRGPHFCDSNPCANGATCTERPNMLGISVGFRCQCTRDWVGVICDRPKSGACSSNPCKNRCTCLPSCKHDRGYQCVSENDGFIGRNCDVAVPRVECAKNEIVVNISRDFFREFDDDINNSFMFVNPTAGREITKANRCAVSAARDGNYQLKIDLPFVGMCGTTMASDPLADGIVFENRIWINRDTGLKFDMPVPVIDFSCVYARQYEAVTTLLPLIEPDAPSVEKSGSFSAEISMCKIPACPASCPTLYQVMDEAVYTIGDMIHLRIDVGTAQVAHPAALVPTVMELFLSCSPNSWMPRIATMKAADKRCPQNPGFRFSLQSGQAFSPHSICLSFQVPKAAKCNLIYLHATVQLCQADDLQQCDQHPDVHHCKHRTKRSLDDTDVIAYDVTRSRIGPINIFRGSEGKRYGKVHIDGQPGNVVIFTDKLDLPYDYRSSHPTTRNLEQTSRIVFAVGICLAGAIFLAMLLYWHRPRFGAKEQP